MANRQPQSRAPRPVFALKRSAAAVQAVLLCFGVSTLTLAAAPALAQASSQAAQAQRSFKLPAGPLGQTLSAFAAAAGVELLLDASLLQGRNSPGLSGNYSVDEGFAQLLRGQGLVAQQGANGRYALSRVAAQPAAGELALPLVAARAKAVAATAPYAGGQVAAGSRVGLLGDKDFMETPFSTISYTDKFIADRQAKDITDVIAATDPTVFNNGMTGTFSENYVIRGLAASSNDVSINGLYGVAPFYRANPEMFERIEVLKGPSALLNGMPPGGSVAGAINLVAKRAGDEALTRLTAGYTSESLYGTHLDVGRRLGADKQFGIRFNGVYRKGQPGIRDQQQKTQLAPLGLDWRGASARVSADLYAADHRVQGLNRGLNLAPGVGLPKLPSPTILLNPDWAYFETRDKGATARGEWDLSEQLMAYVAVGLSKSEYISNSAGVGLVLNAAGDTRSLLGQLEFEVNKKSADVGLKGKFQTGSVGHQWALNATHYVHNNKEAGRRVPETWTTNLYNPVWGPAPSYSVSPFNDTDVRLSSLGLADILSFAQNRVQLTLGLRHQRVASDSRLLGTRTVYEQSSNSPALALLVRATDHLSVYANAIEGLSQGAAAPIDAANKGEVFPPYKSKQMELGLKFDAGDFAHTLSLYEIKRPSSYTDPVSNVFSFGGEQRNRGLEWGFFGAALRDVRLMGGVALVDPKLTKTKGGVNQGKLATGAPQQQAKLGVEWDTSWVQGLTVTANAKAVSRQFINADNSLVVPGYTVYDLGARYATALASRPLTLRASVANVTNKAYWGMPLLVSLGVGAPRTFSLSATLDF